MDRYLYTHRVETWAISFTLYRLPLPARTGQCGKVGQQHQHAKYYKNVAPCPQQHRIGVTKTKIDYILTNRPYIVTDVTVISQVNIGSDHRLVMSNIKLDVEVERKQSMAKMQPRVDAAQIELTKIEF